MTRTNERGSAMIIVTILVMVLAATSVALLTEVAYTQKAGKESMDGDEGYIIARAGLERTRRALLQYYKTDSWVTGLGTNGAAQWSDILQFTDPNQVPPGSRVFNTSALNFTDLVRQNYSLRRTEADFVAYRANPNAPGAATTPEAPDKTSTQVIFGQASPFRTGGYHVTLRNNASDPGGPFNDTDRIMLATSTSVLDDGTVRRLEADLFFVDPDTYSGPGVLTSGSMNISGNPTIVGANPHIHANQNMIISGNPIVNGNVTAVGTVTVTGNPTVGGSTSGGQPTIPLPPINPADWFDDRDYYMRSDGRILNKAGVTVHNGGGGVSWHGFKYNSGSPPKWDLVNPGAEGPPLPATYYIEGSLVIGSNIGNQAGDPPVRATFITTHSIEIAGNPGIAPYLGDLQAIAGTDIKISGNPDLDDYAGFWGAREQIMVSGNPGIYGALVAANASNTDGTVAPGNIGSSQIAVVINGDVRLETPPKMTIPFGGGASVEVLQLRQIR